VVAADPAVLAGGKQQLTSATRAAPLQTASLPPPLPHPHYPLATQKASFSVIQTQLIPNAKPHSKTANQQTLKLTA